MMKLPEWAQSLFNEEYRYFAIRGGRGSSKSRSVASALIVRVTQDPLRILCTREIQKSIKDSVKRLLDDEIDRLKLNDFFISTESEIRGSNGSLFIFAGLRSNIDSIKSMEGVDICWCEESQTISQSSLDTLIPTIRKECSQIIFTWNPKHKTDPVDVMFMGETVPPKTKLIKVNHSDNPWFPDVLKEELEYDRSRDYGKYAHIWLGEYLVNSEANVFKNWTVEEFERPVGTVYRLGADWGFSVDPSVLIRCSIEGRRLYVDYEAYMVGCEIDQLPDLFDRVPESRKWFITADSARPETISYMRKHGYPKINSAIKGKNSVEEGIEFLKSYDIIVHPRCTHLIDELTLYSYKIDSLTSEILPILEDKNNHVVDSLRYALEGMRKAVIPKDQQAVIRTPRKHGWMK